MKLQLCCKELWDAALCFPLLKDSVSSAKDDKKGSFVAFFLRTSNCCFRVVLLSSEPSSGQNPESCPVCFPSRERLQAEPTGQSGGRRLSASGGAAEDVDRN